VLGGYYSAAGVSVALGFVLAVMTPGVDGALAGRELGWIGGVVVAGVAAVALWPVHQRDRVRLAAAALLRETATCLARPGKDRALAGRRAASATLVDRAGVVYRPAGSIAKESALVALVVSCRRLRPLVAVTTTAELSPDADNTPEYGALASTIATTFA